MALYRPDYKYIEAEKVVNELGDSKKDMAIKYYINYHKNWHDEDKKILEKFHGFFNQLDSFLPKNGGILG